MAKMHHHWASSPYANSGALVRFLAVSLCLVLNFLCLLRLLFRSKARLCSHTFSYGLTLLLLNLYLSSWIPYLFSSFYHATAWPLLEVNTHCAIQHLVCIQVSTLLLVILCLQKLFETFSSKRAKVLSAVIFFIWIFPQSIYSVMSEIMSVRDNNNLYWLDSAVGSMRNGQYSLTSPEPPPLSPKTLTIDQNTANLISADRIPRQGVLFCIHRLDSSMISHMTWHYVVLVVPLTSLFIICTGAQRFAKSSFSGEIGFNVNCHCQTDLVSTLCLYCNFIWLLLARPMLSLMALLQKDFTTTTTTPAAVAINNATSVAIEWTRNTMSQPPSSLVSLVSSLPQSSSAESLSLDLGSHLLMFVISILLPFSSHYGLWANSSNGNTTNAIITTTIPHINSSSSILNTTATAIANNKYNNITKTVNLPPTVVLHCHR